MPPEIDFYNPRSLILFVCILQGLIFAALLFIRGIRKRTNSDYLLAFLLILMCSSLITHFIGFANVYDNNQWLTYFPFEFSFAHAPVLYLYVKTLTDSARRLGKKDVLLFIPAMLYWTFFFGLFLQTVEIKDWYGGFSEKYLLRAGIDVCLFTWNGILLVLAIRHYRKYRSWLDDNYSDTELIKFNWLRNFLYIFASVFVLESVFDIIGGFVDFSYVQAFYLKLFIAVVTYYLAVSGYLRSSEIRVEFDAESAGSQSKSTLDELSETKEKLLDLMDRQKPYLEPQLTLSGLATSLGVNTSRLSQTINRGCGKNFNDFVNEYRISEVKKRIAASDLEESTLLDIALSSGFNSKATFNRAFKKFTEVSPRDYAESRSQD